MKSALMMHGYSKDVLNVKLIQMVRFIKDGVEKKASKRAGDAYKIRELVEEVGKDAARYFFAMRSPSNHLDFDLSLAIEHSSNNPVYYVQYAHARMCSVLALAQDITPSESCKLLTNEKEKTILKQLASFPKAVEDAANELEPNKISNYVHELAENVHSWYNDTKILDKTNIEVTKDRLGLCCAIKQVISNALNLIGVDAPDHM
jgi:arginyl-tRNA synthetase